MSQLIKRVSVTLDTCTLGWVDHSQLPRVWASNHPALLHYGGRKVLGAQGTRVSPGSKTGVVWVTSLPDCYRGSKCGKWSGLVGSRLPELFCYLCHFIRSHSLSHYKGKGHPITCNEGKDERKTYSSVHKLRRR